jgi:hypothetical protein
MDGILTILNFSIYEIYIYIYCKYKINNFMSFRNIKLRTQTDPDVEYSTDNQFYATDNDLRYRTGFLKKGSNRSNVRTK